MQVIVSFMCGVGGSIFCCNQLALMVSGLMCYLINVVYWVISVTVGVILPMCQFLWQDNIMTGIYGCTQKVHW